MTSAGDPRLYFSRRGGSPRADTLFFAKLPSMDEQRTRGTTRHDRRGTYDLVCFGEILWDTYENARRPGGAPLNVAVTASLLGLDCAVVSAVGDDAGGRDLLAAVSGTGLSTFVQTNPYPTGRAVVSLSGNGIPRFHIPLDAAFDHIAYTEEVAAACASAKYLYYGTLAQRMPDSRRTLRALLRREEPRKVYDVNLRPGLSGKERTIAESLSAADVAKLNRDEARRVCCLLGYGDPDRGSLNRIVEDFSLRCLVVTEGAEGASLYTRGGGYLRADAPRVEVVDTTGCGDAFTASFIRSVCRGKTEAEALRDALELAAKTATFHGAIPESL